MAYITGRDPWDDPHRAYIDTYRALDVDWVMGIPSPRLARDAFSGSSSIELWYGRRMTEWGLSGSSWQEEYCFHGVEDVLDYDPVKNEPHVEMVSDLVGRESAEHVRRQQAEVGNALLISGIYYTTLFQWCIMVFSWPLFLTAAGAEPDRFQHVLEGFAEI